MSIYSNAEPGAHIYVGTERGFIAIGMSPNASMALLTDVNDRVTKYNLINIALLKMSKDRVDYLELRYSFSPEEWIARGKSSGLTSAEMAIFSDREAIRAWNKVNFDPTESELAIDPREERRENPKAEVIAFEDANYLHYEEQFERVRTMAREGRIVALNIDLRDHDAWNKITGLFARNNERISILDISNAWEEGYIGLNGVNELRQKISSVSTADAKLIITKLRNKNSIRMWNYNQFRVQQEPAKFIQEFISATIGCSALEGKFAI